MKTILAHRYGPALASILAGTSGTLSSNQLAELFAALDARDSQNIQQALGLDLSNGRAVLLVSDLEKLALQERIIFALNEQNAILDSILTVPTSSAAAGSPAQGALGLPTEEATGPTLGGLKQWLAAGLGVTYSNGAIVAAGTVPPTLTLTGTFTGVHIIVITCTFAGILGTWTYTWTLDGVQQGGTITSAASVAVSAGGIAAFNWAAGAASTNDTWTIQTSATAWADQSGNAINDTVTGSPPLAANMLNGQPGFTLNGTTQGMSGGSTQTNWSLSAATQFMVFTPISSSNGNLSYLADQIIADFSSYYGLTFNSAGNLYAFADSTPHSVSKAISFGTPITVYSRWDSTGNTLYLSVNGGAEVSVGTSGSLSSSAIVIGGVGRSHPANMAIFESLSYNINLGPAGIAKTLQYLRAKYGTY